MIFERCTMMKFKYLFRRGHGSSSSSGNTQRTEGNGSHIGSSAVSHTNEPRLRPAASVSCLDNKSEMLNTDTQHQQNKPRSLELGDSKTNVDIDVETIKKDMEAMAQDKAALESKVQELISCHGELETLRLEVSKLKVQKKEAEQELMEHLDQLQPSSQPEPGTTVSNQNYAPVPESIAPSEVLDPPDWDKRSTSSLSEVSVACLQDRIMQMEETHYSTNEELQATLQELADLQSQLTDLQNDNERLGEEKGVLLDSLVRQTEKLEDARTKMGTLQELLLDNPSGTVGTTEREQKLVELLKCNQEERESLMVKQEELQIELNELRRTSEATLQENGRLCERVQLLESTIDATHAERMQLDLELAQAKEECSSKHIEISRLTTLLENARTKIREFEEARSNLEDKSELDELIDNVRKEKDVLESQAASLNDQLARCQCEISKLKTQLSCLQEECVVLRKNARSAVSDLEYECEQGRNERAKLLHQLQCVQDSYSELQIQCQCHMDDKRQLKTLLTETQQHLGECEGKLAETEAALSEQKRLRKTENSEWDQFQSDLLMTVRVANEFKTEAQVEMEKLVLENKQLRDKTRALDAQIDKLKLAEKQLAPPLQTAPVSSDKNPVLTSVTQEMTRRRKNSSQDSRLSVKSLIESIENVTKQVKTGQGALRSSSTSSLNSIASLPPTVPSSPVSEFEFKPPLPLRDQQQLSNKQPKKKSIFTEESFKINKTSSDDTVPAGATILSSRNLEFARRNSCADLSERKDPLLGLAKNGGSKRNALLKWCQNKTLGYKNIDITNFSSSWNDGLALCAMLHSYLPERVPFDTLTPNEKRRNFSVAFSAAESVGITTSLNINDMIQQERPDWQQVMAYVTAIYKHFET